MSELFQLHQFLRAPGRPHFFQSRRRLPKMKDLGFETQWHSSLFLTRLASQDLLEIGIAGKVFEHHPGGERKGVSKIVPANAGGRLGSP